MMNMIKQLRPLVQESLVRSYSAGSTILYQGEAPRSACIIVKGSVRVFSISPQGDEQIVMFHVAGEFFPSSWIFGKAPSTLFFYEALTDCKIGFLTREAFIKFMNSSADRMNAILDYFTTNYSASLIRINALEQPRARDKLIYTLYFLCERYGVKNSPRIRIPIALTHQHLAGLVGLTRETTAMEMGKLKKQGVLTYRQQQYTVHLERLLELVGEESFRGLSISS